MDTNKILLIVLILIVFMVIVNHIIIITPTLTTSTTTTQVVPVPVPKKPIGGCAGTRYGCCPNGSTPKANYLGSNCNL
jgi:hypothetical protein